MTIEQAYNQSLYLYLVLTEHRHSQMRGLNSSLIFHDSSVATLTKPDFHKNELCNKRSVLTNNLLFGWNHILPVTGACEKFDS